MHLITLHDYLNPNEEVPMDADDFSVCMPYLSGSIVRLKSSDSMFQVHERPHEIMTLIKAAEEGV